MHTELVTIAGRETLLLVLPPNWVQPVAASFELPSDVGEAVTGLQERRPEGASLRVSLRYLSTLAGLDLQLLRQALGGLNGRPVAVPFWPDVMQSNADGTIWAERMLNGQHYVGWDDGFTNVTVASGEPNRKHRSALLIGRLSPATLRAISDRLADLSVQFSEDSDWNSRVWPAASDPGVWSGDWSIDWTTLPEQSQRILVEHKQLGRQRNSIESGTADVALWGQRAALQLGRAEQRGLLAFYAGRQGGVEAFDLPSALQPGSDTPTAPHQFNSSSGRVRFLADLRFEWTLPQLADIRLTVEQQVESQAVVQQHSGVAYLYTFSYEGLTLRLTDWDSPVTASGATWSPARIEHDRIRNTLKPQGEECEIKAALADIPLAEPLLRLEMEGQLHAEIALMELPSGGPHTLFSGTVKSARAKQSLLTLKLSSISGALKRKLPRFAYSHRCNHTLFNYGCRLKRPSQMQESAWMYTGTIAYQWDQSSPRVVLTSFAAPSGKPTLLNDLEGYFAGGWLEVAWGTPQRQVREVVWSGTHTQAEDPDRLFLAMYRVLRGDVAGLPVRFWPGCNGSFNTCITKFGNADSFGGFPHQPAWIQQASMGTPKGGK